MRFPGGLQCLSSAEGKTVQIGKIKVEETTGYFQYSASLFDKREKMRAKYFHVKQQKVWRANQPFFQNRSRTKISQPVSTETR